MKLTIYLLLVMCLPPICNAQNANLTIGRGTNCFGRGACSITIENTNQYNATFIKKPDGTTLLRVYRQKLDKQDEDRILGNPITSLNMNSLKFMMEEEIPINPAIIQSFPSSNSKKIDKLKVGVYSTTISTKYIDILILDD